jgi:hypothetical protein
VAFFWFWDGIYFEEILWIYGAEKMKKSWEYFFKWFFFRVSNVQKGQVVRFNILNLAKPDSLYNEGMKVLSYSNMKRQSSEDLGWHRIGTNISYYQNNFVRENMRFKRFYFTLTFTHTFEFDKDTVYFAHCFPYTYTDLTEDLTRLERIAHNFMTRSTLCRTLAGNRCEYITITSKRKEEEKDSKKE